MFVAQWIVQITQGEVFAQPFLVKRVAKLEDQLLLLYIYDKFVTDIIDQIRPTQIEHWFLVSHRHKHYQNLCPNDLSQTDARTLKALTHRQCMYQTNIHLARLRYVCIKRLICVKTTLTITLNKKTQTQQEAHNYPTILLVFCSCCYFYCLFSNSLQ